MFKALVRRLGQLMCSVAGGHVALRLAGVVHPGHGGEHGVQRADPRVPVGHLHMLVGTRILDEVDASVLESGPWN